MGTRSATPALACLFLAACASERIYFGDVHGHTRNSDGQGSVRDYFTWARDHSMLDFAIVTDHDFGHEARWRMPESVWEETQASADAFTQDGRFVAIAGYEWTSQRKYWSGFESQGISEHLFPGPPHGYNHKNVYFPARVARIFSAKDADTRAPDALAAAVARAGGLIHNNHPDSGPESAEQWDYSSASARVIANTEIGPDRMLYGGQSYAPGTEATVRAFFARGGRTGLLAGSDTHAGQPEAHTAVRARELTRAALFDALRDRHCYAISHARIELRFEIDGRGMGEEVACEDAPRLFVEVRGTAPIAEIVVVRDGVEVQRFHPEGTRCTVAWTDTDCRRTSSYYVRVTQTDTDAHGNPSRAWSSPIWVERRVP
jgi:hypothetical protein